MGFDVAAVGGGEEFLQPRGGPFHRAADLAGGVGGDDILRVQAGFHAEAAADVADDDADLFGGETERAAEGVAGAGGHLAGEAQRQAVGCAVIGGEGAARLHGCGGEALVDEVEGDDVGGGGEGGVEGGGVAVLHLGGDVAGGGGPDERRAGGGGLLQFGDDWQFVIVDEDGFERVLGLFGGFGDQRDHGLPHETDGFVGEGGTQRGGAGGAVGSGENGSQRQRLDAGRDEVGSGDYGENAWHCLRRRDVDGGDAGVREGRAQERQAGLLRQREVIGEVAGACQQTGILDSANVASAAVAPDRR